MPTWPRWQSEDGVNTPHTSLGQTGQRGGEMFEITGKGSKVDQFIAIMKPLGLVEICRTGVAAMNRGPQGM